MLLELPNHIVMICDVKKQLMNCRTREKLFFFFLAELALVMLQCVNDCSNNLLPSMDFSTPNHLSSLTSVGSKHF